MWHLFISWIILDLYVVARKKFRKGWFKMYQASSEFFILSSKFQSTNNKTLVYRSIYCHVEGWCYIFWPYLLLLGLACLVIWQTRLEMSPSQKYLDHMKVSFEKLEQQVTKWLVAKMCFASFRMTENNEKYLWKIMLA